MRARPVLSKAFKSLVFAGFFAVPALVQPTAAGPVDAQYAISVAGIPLGTADITGSIDAASYDLSVQAKLSAIAQLVTTGQGAARAAGTYAGLRPVSRGYALTASNSQMSRTIQLGMAGQDITLVKVQPPFEAKPDRVLVEPSHLKQAVDPVSALIMPVGGGDGAGPGACNRVIPVFDGAHRFNVSLSYAATRNVVKKGVYQGPVVICRARYMPVAGHVPSRPETKFMAQNRDMEVWLAPVPGAPVMVPFRIAVKTMLGTTLIEAQKFNLGGLTAQR